jgi:hypothetical protein
MRGPSHGPDAARRRGRDGRARDAVAFFRALFAFSLIVLLGLFSYARRAIMSLFPDIPNRIYRTFLAGLDRIYPLVLSVTVATAVPIQNVVRVTKRGECVSATLDVRVAKSDSARPAFGV